MSEKINIVFLGTPEFACPFLEKLATDSRFQVKAVITQEDKPVGRKKLLTPSPIKELSQKLNLPLFQPIKLNKDLDLLSNLEKIAPDFLVVVAYGQILSNKVLQIPRIKAINVHGSILPKYRGASPIEQALLNGDSITGLSIMEMVKAMDAGPIHQILELPIADNDNNQSLRKKLSEFGASQLPDLLIQIKKGELSAIPQNETLTSYCKKINKEDGNVNPTQQTAQEIINHWKAYSTWPGIFLKQKEKTLKLIQIELNNTISPTPGNFEIINNQLFLGTKKGTLEIKTLQLEGKTIQDTKSFLSGNKQLFS
jgi:methionyl-tRNA formyltransferase